MKRLRWTACLAALGLGSPNHALAAPPAPRFDVKLASSARTQPVDGRLIVVVSKKLEGPDPVDFHAFQLVNLYEETNGYFDVGPFGRLPKPLGRLKDGRLLTTMEDFSHQGECARNARTLGRPAGRLPRGVRPGRPRRLPGSALEVRFRGDRPRGGRLLARALRSHGDPEARLAYARPQAGGQAPRHDGDQGHLLSGWRRALDGGLPRGHEAAGPWSLRGGSFEYGDNEPHCYVGKIPSGQTLEMHYLPIFAAHMRALAPEGADVTSWMK